MADAQYQSGTYKEEQPQSHNEIHIPKPNREDTITYGKQSFCQKYCFSITFFIVEIIIIILFALCTKFSITIDATTSTVQNAESQEHVKQYYPAYQDVHVMLLIGFGMLYTYLQRNGWYSMSINFALLVYCIQISILLNGFFHGVITGHLEIIEVEIKTLISADYAAAAVLISLGGVLGKLNSAQLFCMASIELLFYAPNLALGESYLFAMDMGGSMYIHTFGAYFGLAVTWIVSYDNPNVYQHPNNKSGHTSNLFAFIGTAFLWLFWPSFNGALATGNSQQRIIVNTVLSLTGSALAVFIMSPLISKNGKSKMEHILNATLAGGVAIGACCDVIGRAWSSIMIGFIAGMISTIGFEYLSPILQSKCKIYDTAGIHNLHGLPGVFGSLAGIILAAYADQSLLKISLASIFPEMDKGRTVQVQAQMQGAALGASLLFSIVGGIITGFILRCKCWNQPYHAEDMYNDLTFFDEAEDLEHIMEKEEQEHLAEQHHQLAINTQRVEVQEIEMQQQKQYQEQQQVQEQQQEQEQQQFEVQA